MTARLYLSAAIPFFAACLAAAPVPAQDDWSGGLDTNLDNLVDETEWQAGASADAAWSAWDADSDGELTEEEFSQGYFAMADADSDGVVSEAEFNSLMGSEDWSQWDADGSGDLDQEDFSEGLETAGLYDEWDSDGSGTISRDEFTTGNFALYDLDQSGGVDEAEMRAANEPGNVRNVGGETGTAD